MPKPTPTAKPQVRWRTKTMPNGQRVRVAVLHDAGPKGGRVVVAEVIEEGEPHRGTQRRST